MIHTTRDISPAELRRRARERFATAQRVEAEYLRALRQLTRQIDHIVKGITPKGDPSGSAEVQTALRAYASAITPWARAVAARMVAQIARKDETAWAQLGRAMNRALKEELQTAPVATALAELQAEQVKLITSLPLEAADRVQKLALEALTTGRSKFAIAKDILASGAVAESRAKLIARTETAKAASNLTMVRAQHVGSTHYIWRTAGDHDVRESHQKMKNKVIAWSDPPEVDPGHRYHAGQFPNCRCYPEPILPDEE